MRTLLTLLALALALAGLSPAQRVAGAAAQANDPGITANGVIGEVVAVDQNAKQLFVKTDAGSVVVVAVADNSRILRNPPGEQRVDKATPMTLAEITAGDRVFARGSISDDRKTVTGRILIINTKADIEKKRETERAEWQRRGITGVVSAVNPEAKEITISTRTPEGPKPVVIPASGEAVKLRRYAPDSIKFADAKPSTFEEVKVGDQLRAKGERSADGARFTAEEVVTGTFRTALGTVKAVDAAKNEITIQQAQDNKPLTIVVRPDSVLKQIPADFAAMMGGGPGGPGGAAAPPAGGPAPAGGERRVVVQAPPGGGTPPAGGQQGGPGGAPGQGGPRRVMMGGGDMVQQMMERMPTVALADLKPGAMIVVSSTVGADPTRVTAIQLVAGVEPLVAMMSRRPGGAGGGGGGMPGMGAAGGGVNFGFGIGQP
ncbi:MAG TPA: hypothetical protein VF611_19870 [Pyrinomonadaceae bacterium]